MNVAKLLIFLINSAFSLLNSIILSQIMYNTAKV